MEQEVDKYSISDLITHSVNKQPVDFENVFGSLIADRLAAAVENKKTEVAQSMFNPQQEVDVEEQDTEEHTEEQQDGETA